MSRQSFIKGTIILLVAGIVNRILGFVPRIALPRIIGAEGIGLYQMGYPFLIVILTLINGGIPLAVAKLVAEADAEGNSHKVRSILRGALAITLTLSVGFTILCIGGAHWITENLFTDDRVYYTFIAMSPIILISGISSVYRGYFQGLHNMIPTAISQTSETLVRIITVLSFAYLMLPYGLEYAAAGAMAGVVVGEIIGLAVLFVQFKADRAKHHATYIARDALTKASQFRRLLSVSIPVTASRLVGSVSYFFESILIIQSLAVAGIATAVATAQYGVLQGMVIPILLLPTALTYSLSVSLIPSLSEAASNNDMIMVHRRMHQSLKLSLVAGAPFAVFMYVLADPLCMLIYNNTEVGSMLRMMAPVALFIYLQGPLQAALQALDKPGKALRNTFIGACIKLTLISVLASNPSFGIRGAIFAININIALVTVLHWVSVTRLLKLSMPKVDFFKVGVAIGISGLLCHLIYSHLFSGQPIFRLSIALLTGLISYMICGIVLKLIDRDDLLRMFWIGKKIVK
jgi:stage V sporulation protein B